MTRAELKAAALDALNRRDLDGAANTWIVSATTRINTLLRHRRMLKHKVLPADDRIFSAPGDFIQAESVQINNGIGGGPIVAGSPRGTLLYAPPDEITGSAAMSGQACTVPQFYTLHGLQFELAPWRGGPFQIDLWYYAKITLGAANDATNFFLDEYPHIYLNVVMTFGHRFLLEQDAALGYEALFGAEIQSINDSEAAAKIGSGPLIVPPRGRAIGARRR